ncbi:MAG: DUF1729 domain-containing protein, partial [Tomitella sp.]|nr:DUF1729 domain-containing protein [Tomitella sp.]
MTIEAFGSGSDDDAAAAAAVPTGAASAAGPNRAVGATNGAGTLADRLRSGEKYAVAFGGQGAPWLDSLTELAADAQLDGELQSLVTEAEGLLAPVLADLVVVRPAGFDPVGWGIEDGRPRASALTSAAVSLPGVLLTQLAAIRALSENGLDLRGAETAAANVATLGHSQGVLAAEALAAHGHDDAQLLAIAELIGAATTLVSRRRGLIGTADRSPMLAVSGTTPERIEAALDEVFGAASDSDTAGRPVLAIRNGRRRVVLTGTPDQLARLRNHCEAIAEREKAERADKTTGGAPFAPVFEHVAVEAGFHHPDLRDAVRMVADWADRCGIDAERAGRLADAILVAPVDWVGAVDSAVTAGARWILDLGPGDLLTRMTTGVVRGTGVGVVPASTRAGQRNLFTPGAVPEVERRWAEFAPTVKTLPDGRTVVETAFTRLTGRSPMLLAGMTPTTVDARIVAAAANAGHWAELAGGGQVTEEIFLNRIDELGGLLEPGRAVQFNSLFLDPYLWKLQVGGKRLVQKARTTGAALDGLIVTAGIPELDDALALVEERAEVGIPYIAFKPGTVSQIRSVVRIAAEVPEHPIIVQVEGGRAGGHHSWEDLDDLLLTTYAELRARENIVLCVGGGIGTPERAADYLTGRWSTEHDFPAMPVDGILVGTAAMAAAEATTAPEVKRMLADTPGTPGWVGAGSAEGGMASGRSQLGADIHEIDNTASRCGRLLDEVAGDADAVAERRDEIIAAMAGTAKPYFGDVPEMTYDQWLRRYVDLAVGTEIPQDRPVWADITWRDRFAQMLHRAEARLNRVEHGPIPTLFPAEDGGAAGAASILDTPHAAVDALLAQYPDSDRALLHPADVSFFIALCRTPGKPVNYVPVIDKDVRRWWRSDSLWQAHDARYGADEVCVIPGPVSVAGITRVDEPVGELLDRFERATTDELVQSGADAESIPARRRTGLGAHVADAIDVVLAAPDVAWAGRHTKNPVHRLGGPAQWRATDDGAEHPLTGAVLRVVEDSGTADFAGPVLELTVPLVADQAVRIRITVPTSVVDGGTPIVTAADAESAMSGLLGVAAGQDLPEVKGGVARINLAWTPELIADHGGVTAAGLPDDFVPAGSGVPDVLVGACWPAVFAAIGSARASGASEDPTSQDPASENFASVIEGMLDLVHLDHAIRLAGPLPSETSIMTVRAETVAVEDSDLGRVVEVHVQIGSIRDLGLETEPVATLVERFAIRGRAGRGELADPQRAGGALVDKVHESPRRRRRQVTVQAPIAMDAFAQVSGDHNPIHVSRSAARLAGLGTPIVHGLWLSAAAQQVATAVDHRDDPAAAWAPTPLAGWTARFLAPVRPGAEIDVRVERVGLDAGREVIEVSCRVEGELVMVAGGVLDAPRPVYAFPGQGIQHKGMGLSARAGSPAAKDVWERADKHTRESLGFSILAVVRDNPTTLTAKGERYTHPDGVLFLTQFTQVAMATLACAQVAELREAGAFVEGSLFAGHSVGEYNALAAVAQVLPLEAVLEVVFHRGSAMHHLVPRDSQGRSDFRLGAIRPSQAGIADDDVTDYIDEMSERTGEFLQVVNYNLRGAQYAIAGTVAGLGVLEEDIDGRRKARGGKKAFILVPGIDVPFHSRVLRDGVPEFRRTLEKLVPHDIDTSILVGRYVPNLVPRAFTLDRDYIQEVRDLVPAEPLDAVLADYETWARNPSALCRVLLIELLAWQFASPVRWIETQDLLFGRTETGGLDVQRFVEVGVGRAPTVANLASQTLKLLGRVGRTPQVLNSERERSVLLCTDTEPEPVDEGVDGGEVGDSANAPAPEAAAPAAAAEPAAAPAAAPGVPRPDDIPFGAGDATRTLIALWTKLRADQITGADTIESLTDGASSRRNQLLVDLGAELNLGAIDGAAEAAMPQLESTVVSLARTYKPFGPVLGDAIGDQLRRVFGPSGKRPAAIGDRVRGEWELGDGWVSHVTAMLVLGTRDGSSVRGGELGALVSGRDAVGPVTDGGSADALIDAAVQAVGEARGIAVSKPAAATGGGVVDSAALGEFAEKVTGPTGVLAETARTILDQLGLSQSQSQIAEITDDTDAELADLVSDELGSDWARQVAPAFDAQRAVLLDDRWASAREDLARMWLAETAGGAETVGGAENTDEAENSVGAAPTVGDIADRFVTVDDTVAAHADWWRRRAASEGREALAAEYAAIASAPRTSAESGEFAGEVAVVTGAGKGSIAGSVVGELLAGGATVVATTSALNAKKLSYFRGLYRDHAREGAALWVLPTNVASFSDIDALIEWVGSQQTESAGGTSTVIKEPMTPTMLFPFAAPRVAGDMRDAGAKSELQMRVLLWAVERLVAGLSGIGADHDIDATLHVVLPGSPNRGTFGGDGAYGEAKASLDALVNRWSSERGWGERVTIVHAIIGWVRGTGLMGGNDPLVDQVEAKGVRTWAPDEIAVELLSAASHEARSRAERAPQTLDLTGGLGEVDLDLAELAGTQQDDPDAGAGTGSAVAEVDNSQVTIAALPCPPEMHLETTTPSWPEVDAAPEDLVVIVGTGELGPYGSARTRFEMEVDEQLSAAGVLELAWTTGMVTWEQTPQAGWYDAESGELVPESEIWERYHDAVVERCGIRDFDDDGAMADQTAPLLTSVFLDKDLSFTVSSEAEARAFLDADPERTVIASVPDSGDWTVTRKAGTEIRVPRRVALSRTVGGQIPTGFDPTRWGIPADMAGAIDRVAQ